MSIKDNAAFQARSLVSTGIRFAHPNPCLRELSTLVPLAPSAVESVCFVQFQRVRQAQDERRIPRTQRGIGREGSAGSHTQRIEGATGHEGAYSPFKSPLQRQESRYNTMLALSIIGGLGMLTRKFVRGIFQATIANAAAVKRDKPSSANSINWTD